MVDESLRNLGYHPTKWHFIQTLDILFPDEFENIPAEIINMLEKVFCYTRKNSTYMDRISIIATSDHRQIRPIKSKPALMSTLVVKNYQMKSLVYSVRARTDGNLR